MLLSDNDDSEVPTEQTLRVDLEKGDIPKKIQSLKKAITLLLQGEKMPSLLMTVIRFVMPQDDHMLKKLCLLFWEVMPTKSPDGKLLHEMILVCDAYRKDLQHPNEYVRGSILRFLCKLKEPELMEPLMPAIRECLSHHHPYVRRNAVMAVYTIFKNFDYLLPDAPELIQHVLESEQDASCKRSAFMMLIAADQIRALDYLSSCIDQVQSFNDILQLVIVELVNKVCRTDVSQRARFIRVIHNLLNSNSASVRYDAAGTMVTLSGAPAAIRAAASCYTELICKEADNNVKLIVLDRLVDLRRNPAHERVLQDIVMDILRVLAAPDISVRRKTLDLCMDLVSSRNASEVVQFLKRELAKTNSAEEFDKTAEYRQLLVRALHSCGVKFPEIAPTIVPQLMEFLSDTSASSAMDVILFVREAFERLPLLRSEMLSKLFENFNQIKASRVSRATMWIIGEYAHSVQDINDAMKQLRSSLGVLPIVDSELREQASREEEEQNKEEPKLVTRTRITADGTYATESAYTTPHTNVKAEKPPLRRMLLEGDFFLATSLAVTVTKISLRHAEHAIPTDVEKNAVKGEAMLMMASVLHLGKSGLFAAAIDEDSYERIMTCLMCLAEPSPQLHEIFLQHSHAAFLQMLESLKELQNLSKVDTKKEAEVQADNQIVFRALRTKEDAAEDEFELNLKQATGVDEDAKDALSLKLNKVFQLSGFSDPVYAEAYVHVHQYDIMLDVLVVNQTGDTLQNLSLELAILGDLKLTEKPSAHIIGPHDFCTITANVKVSSTETGIIFGNIVYDIASAANDRNVVVLNDLHIDIMDYITPAYCSDIEFRSMWAEFEWENKVAVRTSIPTLRGFVDHLLATTNMRCLTPASALKGDSDFLAANLYAKSVFGEDALANLSIEKGPDGQVTGHIRIRSKTQGIALSLGDKITLNQKEGTASEL
jgi:coatomer subunit beta